MNLRESLNKKKQLLLASSNRNFEFDADFENHPLGQQNIYRLHYINYHRFGENYGMGPNNVGVVDYPFKPFALPAKMSREDAFKVLSYLTDYIEKNFEIEACSEKSVAALDKAIDMERLGFTRLNRDENEENVIDLFTITGRLLLFKQSKYYEKYFEWYTEGISFEEIKTIYAKCEMEFYDLTSTEIKGEVSQIQTRTKLLFPISSHQQKSKI